MVTALAEAMVTGKQVIGGRYGLSSKEFTPAMVKGVFDETARSRRRRITSPSASRTTSPTPAWITIPTFSTEVPGTVRALFYGLGADGTVGANKNSIKIIGEETDNYAQGYFVYDSKKSGSMTISHLRFGPQPLHSSYLITKANFVACHQFSFLERIDVLKAAEPGATFLLNSPFGPDEVWDHLPRTVQRQIIDKKLQVLRDRRLRSGQEDRHGRAHQHHHADLLLRHQRRAAARRSHRRPSSTPSRRPTASAARAWCRRTSPRWMPRSSHLHEVKVPAQVTALFDMRPAVPADAPDFVQRVTARIIAGEGDDLPVSAMPLDGTFPTGTAQWEKRNIALEIPVWDEDLCIQCGKCVLVCPHAVIRAKVYDAGSAGAARRPLSKPCPARWKDMQGAQVHAAGGARGLHRLRAVRGRSARPRARAK